MTKNTKPKIFTKERVGNVLAGVVVIWTLWIWSQVLFSLLMVKEPVGDVVLVILAMWNVLVGMAVRQIWGSCVSR